MSFINYSVDLQCLSQYNQTVSETVETDLRMDIKLVKTPDAERPSKQISTQIRGKILAGEIREGAELPSIRSLAEELNVSPSTVSRAYDELKDEGFLEAFAGKGAVVSFLQGGIETGSSSWKAFFSYARKDDERSHGGISAIRKAIEDTYALTTGEELDIFQDTEDIAWGDNWREEIQQNLGITYFFIPIITPTYLRRPACLGELKRMYQIFSETRSPKGIFPIHFVDCSKAIDSLNDDEIASLLKSQQCIMWGDLKYLDPSDGRYQRRIDEIVQRMIDFSEELEAYQPPMLPGTTHQALDENDAGGLIERLGDIDVISADLIEEIQSITSLIDVVGQTFAANNVDQNAPFSKKVVVMRTIAQQLEEPAEQIEVRCKTYSQLIKRMDTSFHALVELSEISASMNNDVPIEAIHSFATTMQKLNEDVKEPFFQLHHFCSVLRNTEKLSRDLHRPLHRVRSAIEDFGSSQKYYREWDDLARKLYEKELERQLEVTTREEGF